MGRRFAELAFTHLVKEQQRQHNSRHMYERVEQGRDAGGPVGRGCSSEFVRERERVLLGVGLGDGLAVYAVPGRGKGIYCGYWMRRRWALRICGGTSNTSVVGAYLEHEDRVTLFLMD